MWQGERTPADDQLCIDIAGTADSVRWTLDLFEAGSPVRANGARRGEPFRVTSTSTADQPAHLCFYSHSLALSTGTHQIAARVTSDDAQTQTMSIRLTVPQLYKVRLNIGAIEVDPVQSGADRAALVTLCMSCLFARPHGTPDLRWIASGHGNRYISKPMHGYRLTRHERTPWWTMRSTDRIEIQVFTYRAVDSSTVFGTFAFTPQQLADASRAGAPLSADHVRSLHLTGSEVVAVDPRDL